MAQTLSLDQLIQRAVKIDGVGKIGINAIAESGSLTNADLSKKTKEQILRGLFSDNGDGTFGLNIFGISGGAISDGSVTNAKLANVPTLTIKGKNTAGTGAPLDLTVPQVQTMLADGVVVTSSTGTSAAYSTTEYVTASVTRTLPTAAASDIGKTITYKAVGASVTIAIGANTIDGASSSIVIPSGDSVTFAVRAGNSVERIANLNANSGGSILTVTTVGTAIFQYEILTGTPVIGYTKTGGAGNGVMTCTGGTIKLRRFTDDILAADLASTAIRFDLVGTGVSVKLARPIPTKYLLNATDALADASTNASTSNQVDIDNTPPVKYGNIVTTGFGSMSVRLDNVSTDIGLDLQW